MDNNQILYTYEHKVLPQFYFELKEKFVMALVNGGEEFLHGFLQPMYKNEEGECPFKKEQFGMKAGRLSDKLMLVRVVFPTPENAPLCYYAYLIFDEAFETARYFTLERGMDEKTMFLCEWNTKGEHRNYGTVGFNEEQIITRCVAICEMKNHEK